eukprot:364965-Chlamydomonas_euryale.AAC.1
MPLHPLRTAEPCAAFASILCLSTRCAQPDHALHSPLYYASPPAAHSWTTRCIRLYTMPLHPLRTAGPRGAAGLPGVLQAAADKAGERVWRRSGPGALVMWLPFSCLCPWSLRHLRLLSRPCSYGLSLFQTLPVHTQYMWLLLLPSS